MAVKLPFIRLGLCLAFLAYFSVTMEKPVYATPERAVVLGDCSSTHGYSPEAFSHLGYLSETPSKFIRWSQYASFPQHIEFEITVSCLGDQQFLTVHFTIREDHLEVGEKVGARRMLEVLAQQYFAGTEAELSKLKADIEALRQMRDLGILQLILPEIVPSFDCAQNRWHVEDVFEHTLSVISRTPAHDRILRLTGLFHDLGKPGTLSIDEAGERHFYAHELLSASLCQEAMRRLKYSNEEIQDVSLLVRHHMRSIDCGVPGVRRLLRDLGPHFQRFRQFQDADKTPILSDDSHRARTDRFDAMVVAELDRLAGTPVDKLTINGDDLIKLGLSPGPIIGKLLKTLGEAVLDTPEINTPELLLEKARSLIEQDPTLITKCP